MTACASEPPPHMKHLTPCFVKATERSEGFSPTPLELRVPFRRRYSNVRPSEGREKQRLSSCRLLRKARWSPKCPARPRMCGQPPTHVL